jgi:F-type H+-transporting ATPase subunit b
MSRGDAFTGVCENSRPARRRSLTIVAVFVFFCLSQIAPVLASEPASEGWGVWETVGRFFNLFLLFGIIIYFIRKPLAEFFENRRREIQQKLAEAEQRKQDAESKLSEIEQRVANIEQELSLIRQRAEQEILDEGRRMEEGNRQETEKILAVARREIDGILRTAQKELRNYAGSLSVSLAEEMIKKNINDKDQRLIFQKFLEEMESMK